MAVEDVEGVAGLEPQCHGEARGSGQEASPPAYVKKIIELATTEGFQRMMNELGGGSTAAIRDGEEGKGPEEVQSKQAFIVKRILNGVGSEFRRHIARHVGRRVARSLRATNPGLYRRIGVGIAAGVYDPRDLRMNEHSYEGFRDIWERDFEESLPGYPV